MEPFSSQYSYGQVSAAFSNLIVHDRATYAVDAKAGAFDHPPGRQQNGKIQDISMKAFYANGHLPNGSEMPLCSRKR
jgi:hypothetical protein